MRTDVKPRIVIIALSSATVSTAKRSHDSVRLRQQTAKSFSSVTSARL